jgi:hypothetical protein
MGDRSSLECSTSRRLRATLLAVRSGETIFSGITADFALFTAGIRLDRPPPEVEKLARFFVLDPLGNIVRAHATMRGARLRCSLSPVQWASPPAVPACSLMRRATRRPAP